MKPFGLDEDLLDRIVGGATCVLRVWEPPSLAVVLGRADRAEREVRMEACRETGVPILRRLGGGGAVILGPGCLVVSLARRVEDRLAVGAHMADAVGRVAAALERATGVKGEVRSTGDLCLGNRKVLGSSAFCRRGVFLYQASLLVSVDPGLMERYLAHPSREPEYRRGRSHREFVTTLAEAGVTRATGVLGQDLDRELRLDCGSPAGGRLVMRNGAGV